MKHWRDEDGTPFENSDVCYGREYMPETGAMNVAKISIRGRLPESGYLYNDEAHEMAVVVRGKGTIQVRGEEPKELTAGDVIYFEPLERIRWDGDMDMIVPCSPAYDPDKHHEEE